MKEITDESKNMQVIVVQLREPNVTDACNWNTLNCLRIGIMACLVLYARSYFRHHCYKLMF